MARIVLNSFGSLGDIHPYLALSKGLKARGHDTLLATAEVYRAKVEAEGINYAPIRPDVGELLNRTEAMERIWHPRTGSEYLIREYILPQLEGSYADLTAACQGADLLLTHVAAYAGPIVAEKMGLRWLSVVLQPMMFFSRYDLPVISGAEWVRPLLKIWPGAAEYKLRPWGKPIADLRHKLGLAPTAKTPLMGEFSPFGTLALFSGAFAKPQADWPPNTTVCGFPFYDLHGEIDGEFEQFLDSGPAPLIFTLGSSAVWLPGEFYETSTEAAARLGRRALLVGASPRAVPETVHVTAYAPYSQVLPRGAATIHQGGVGTTAQALRAGKPMLVVPYSHDQPDNAERIVRLGAGRTLKRKRYTTRNLVRELEALLGDEQYASRAGELGGEIAGEDGVSAACDAIERVLRSDVTRFGALR